MNKNVFTGKMSDLSKAYNRYDLNKEDTIQVWYKFLHGFNDDVFIHSVDKYIKENHNPPAISDLLTLCKNLKHLKEQGVRFEEN